jgi:ribonuclease HI
LIKKEENTIYSEYGVAAYDSINNVAEYTGIIKGLEWLLAKNYENESKTLRGDSQLDINQSKNNSIVSEGEVSYFQIQLHTN